jgi:hypothetical protein
MAAVGGAGIALRWCPRRGGMQSTLRRTMLHSIGCSQACGPGTSSVTSRSNSHGMLGER